MGTDRKIVITGIGVLSPIGIGKDAFCEALFQGKTGFKTISLFDTSSFNVHSAGEIRDFDPISFLGKKGLRTLDRSTRLLSSAAKLAIEDAHLQITDENTNSIGVSIGTTFGSLHSISQFDREGLIEGPRFVNPSYFPNTVINSPASQVSIRFKIKGFNTTISTGFCASLDAVSYAADFIKLNRADVVLAGGVEELCEETFLGFYRLGCLGQVAQNLSAAHSMQGGTALFSPRVQPFLSLKMKIMPCVGVQIYLLQYMVMVILLTQWQTWVLLIREKVYSMLLPSPCKMLLFHQEI
jgi:3-oxoacyl-(acyl-carrier-protein) synthase